MSRLLRLRLPLVVVRPRNLRLRDPIFKAFMPLHQSAKASRWLDIWEGQAHLSTKSLRWLHKVTLKWPMTVTSVTFSSTRRFHGQAIRHCLCFDDCIYKFFFLHFMLLRHYENNCFFSFVRRFSFYMLLRLRTSRYLRYHRIFIMSGSFIVGGKRCIYGLYSRVLPRRRPRRQISLSSFYMTSRRREGNSWNCKIEAESEHIPNLLGSNLFQCVTWKSPIMRKVIGDPVFDIADGYSISVSICSILRIATLVSML